MAVELEKLLALKAFYLGNAIGNRADSRAVALPMTEAAIAQINIAEHPCRLAFYHLLRAEILRHCGSPKEDRKAAQTLCNEVDSPLYDYFMKVEEATEGTLDVERNAETEELVVREGAVRKRRTGHDVSPDGFWSVKNFDYAIVALNISEQDFCEQDRRFIWRVSLKQMLDKHDVQWPITTSVTKACYGLSEEEQQGHVTTPSEFASNDFREPLSTSGDLGRTKRIRDELATALNQLPEGTLAAWSSDTATSFAKITFRRINNLVNTVGWLASSASREISAAVKQAERGTFNAYLKQRMSDLSESTDATAKRYAKTVSKIVSELQSNPQDTAPRLLLTTAAFLTTSGGLDANGGAPDTDLLFGIDAHRSLFTHSILMGAAIETMLIAAVTLSDRVCHYLPEDHDPLWDKLQEARQMYFVPIAQGASAGVAYHLVVDGTLQPGAYHDLPFEAPMEIHQGILVGNATAEALDIKHKVIQKSSTMETAAAAVRSFVGGFLNGWHGR